jgi:hypothetical protein
VKLTPVIDGDNKLQEIIIGRIIDIIITFLMSIYLL